MDAIRIMFRTPEAIVYREIDLDLGLDIDVSCWISASVIVTEYPKEYTYEVILKNQVREISLMSLKEFLQTVHDTCNGKIFYTSKDRDDVLKKTIEEALRKKGINSKASIAFFTLSRDSEALINDCIKNQNSPVIHDDKANTVPKEERYGVNNYWDPNSWPKPVVGMKGVIPIPENHQEKEWTCPNCKTVNMGKFCSGCGTQRSFSCRGL